MSLYVAFSLVAAVSASNTLFPRNNPPQPPCVYPYTRFVYSGCFKDSTASRALPFSTDLEFTNATVEQCAAYCKGNNYRYAGLEYHGQCFCGASVSAQSAPEEECNLPCNGDESQACGGEDRVSIYQDPTFQDADDIAISSDYLSLGCYTEGASGRSLDYSQWDFLNTTTMTTETCLTACGAKGFPFAGTEFGRECYCGVVLGNGTTSTAATECSTPCNGNSTQYCGGQDRLSLYVAKNLESTEPCGPPVISSSSIASSTPTPTSSSIASSTPTPISSSIASSIPTPTSSKVSYSSSVKTIPSKSSSTSCKTTVHTPTKPFTKSTAKYTSTPKSTPKTTSSTKKPSTTSYKTSSTPKSTAKTSSSTKKTSTLKTTTSCKSSSTVKSTAKVTSTKKGGWWV